MESDEIETFTSWSTKRNIVWHSNIRLNKFAHHGIGFDAVGAIDAGVVCEIPESVLITPKLALVGEHQVQIRHVASIYEEGSKQFDELVIILFLILQRQFCGVYMPYIALFPSSYNSSPFYWSENDFALFDDSPVGNRAFGLCEGLKETFQAIEERILQVDPMKQSFIDFTWDAFRWAYLSVVSRAFTILIDGREVLAMVPFADSANYHWDAQISSKIFDSESRKFLLSANSRIEADREVFLKYADLDSWSLLMYYGFTMESNPFDTIQLSIEQEAEEEEQLESEIKKILLMQCSRDWFSLDHEITKSTNEHGEPCVVFPESLLPSLRLMVATPGELENLTIDNVEMKMKSFVSVDNENSTLQTLRNILEYLQDVFTFKQPELAKENHSAALLYMREQQKLIALALNSLERLKAISMQMDT